MVVSATGQRQRQAHRKSRMGCARCKRNHRKCDEAFPSCGLCQRAGVACSLQSPRDPSSPSETEDRPVLAVDDLRLLYHWMKGDGRLFADHDPDRCRQERDHQVGLALDRPFLMHAILAVAALELFHHDPDNLDLYTQAATHHCAALGAARPNIPQTGREHSEPLFLFSAFASIYAFAEPPLRTLSPVHRDSVDVLGDLVNAFHMGRGIVTIIDSNLPYLDAIGKLDRSAWPDETHEVMPTLHADFPQLQCLLDLVESHTHVASRVHLSKATTQLFAIISLLQRRPKTHSSARLIQTWPMHADDSLLTLWKVRDPVALLVLAHYAVAIHLRSNLWFFERWPPLIVECVWETVDPAWQRYLEWPRTMTYSDPGTNSN